MLVGVGTHQRPQAVIVPSQSHHNHITIKGFKRIVMNENTKARAGVLLANFFFGTSVIAVKHISPSLIPPFALTAVRITVTMVLFWSMYAMRPVKMGIVKKDFLRLLFCALLGI